MKIDDKNKREAFKRFMVRSGKLLVIKSGRKKMLRGVMGIHEIADRSGWHYEEAE